MSWTTKDRRAHNTTTGARNMREHRAAKRKQAEARNALTPDAKRRVNRRDQDQDNENS